MTGSRPSLLSTRAATPDETTLRAWLNELRAWLAEVGSVLIDVDGAAGVNPEPGFRNDLAAGFALWQAVSGRITAIDAHRLDRSDGRASIVAECWLPVVGLDGVTVAADLNTAVERLQAGVAALSASHQAAQGSALAVAESWHQTSSALADAERLADELGDQRRRVEELAQRLHATARTTAVPGELSSAIDTVVQQLRSLQQRRVALLDRSDQAASDIQRLQDLHAQAVEAVERCRGKITDAPRLAIPTLDGLTPPAEVRNQVWSSVRASVEQWVTLIDRLERSFHEIIKRNTAPILERDELRGLIQSFRDKAAARGIAEQPELDDAYAAARELLWAAPCDLQRARELVDRYVAVVNQSIKGVHR